MKWTAAPCEAGDMIRVKLGSVYHYGIFCSEDEVIAFGMPPLPEYHKEGEEITVIRTDIDVFACSQIVEKAVFDRKERKARFSPQKTLEIARSHLGEGGYDIVHRNCEHFVNECVFGVSRSSQEEEMRARFRARPILDCYFVKGELSAHGDKIYPEKRWLEILMSKDRKVAHQKETAWELLYRGAGESFGEPFENLRFSKSFSGKWSCGKFYFSIARAGEYTAVALASAPVGLDLETVGHFLKASEPEKDNAFTDDSDSSMPSEAMLHRLKAQAAYKRTGKGKFREEKIVLPPEKELLCAQLEKWDTPLFAAICCEHAGNARFFWFASGKYERLRPKTL